MRSPWASFARWAPLRRWRRTARLSDRSVDHSSATRRADGVPSPAGVRRLSSSARFRVARTRLASAQLLATRAGAERWSALLRRVGRSRCSTSRRAPAWSPPSCSPGATAVRRSRPERRDAGRGAYARFAYRTSSRVGAARRARPSRCPSRTRASTADFTYLLRYMDDPPSHRRASWRAWWHRRPRPSLEFGVPRARSRAGHGTCTRRSACRSRQAGIAR